LTLLTAVVKGSENCQDFSLPLPLAPAP
jgi:hypothetical protein